MIIDVRAAAAALGLALAGCGAQSSPCSVCPALEGTYAMQWSAPMLSGSCSAELLATPLNLVLTRAGSRLITSFGGYRLEGTLFDSLDFNLSSLNALADAGSESVRLQGFATAPGSRADGGGDAPRLEGRLTVQGQADCSLTRQFTGVRQ